MAAGTGQRSKAKGSIDDPVTACQAFQKRSDKAVRIPRELELQGKDAIMRKDGQILTIEPTRPKSLITGARI